MVARRSRAASFTTEPGWLRPSSRRSEVRSAPSASLPSIPAEIPTAIVPAPRGTTPWKPWKIWRVWTIWRTGHCRVANWALPTARTVSPIVSPIASLIASPKVSPMVSPAEFLRFPLWFPRFLQFHRRRGANRLPARRSSERRGFPATPRPPGRFSPAVPAIPAVPGPAARCARAASRFPRSGASRPGFGSARKGTFSAIPGRRENRGPAATKPPGCAAARPARRTRGSPAARGGAPGGGKSARARICRCRRTPCSTESSRRSLWGAEPRNPLRSASRRSGSARPGFSPHSRGETQAGSSRWALDNRGSRNRGGRHGFRREVTTKARWATRRAGAARRETPGPIRWRRRGRNRSRI